MKNTLSSLFALVLLSACTPTLAATPLPVSTALPAATAIPSATATVPPTATIVPTNSPTLVPSPTKPPDPPTPAPTATVRKDDLTPQLPNAVTIFRPDLANGDSEWTYNGKGFWGSDSNDTYVFDNDPRFGWVLRANVNGPPPEKNREANGEAFHRLYPGYFPDKEYGNNVSIEFSVLVRGLKPNNLVWYHPNPWLSIFSAFNRSSRLGDPKTLPYVMVNLVGSPGKYYLATVPIDENLNGRPLPNNPNAPTFPMNEFVKIRVDLDNQLGSVFTYQNDMLVSKGSLNAQKKVFKGMHLGLYASEQLDAGEILEKDVVVNSYK